jgi:hypothetical protein
MTDALTASFENMFVNDTLMSAFNSGSMSWADLAESQDPDYYKDVERPAPVAPAPTPLPTPVPTMPEPVADVSDGFQLVKRKSTNNLKTIVCRNLPRDAKREELRKLFEVYGPTKDVYIPVDKSTGNIRGFGFIEFIKADDAQHAYDSQSGQLVIRKRNITVEFKAAN